MAPTTDPRFARLQTDPRFRRPKQKNLKVEIDERFRDVLEGEEFGGVGKGKGKTKDGQYLSFVRLSFMLILADVQYESTNEDGQ